VGSWRGGRVRFAAPSVLPRARFARTAGSNPATAAGNHPTIGVEAPWAGSSNGEGGIRFAAPSVSPRARFTRTAGSNPATAAGNHPTIGEEAPWAGSNNGEGGIRITPSSQPAARTLLPTLRSYPEGDCILRPFAPVCNHFHPFAQPISTNIAQGPKPPSVPALREKGGASW